MIIGFIEDYLRDYSSTGLYHIAHMEFSYVQIMQGVEVTAMCGVSVYVLRCSR